MKHLFILLLALCLGMPVPAQQNKQGEEVALFGEVYDSFTKTPLKAKLVLMDKDSVVIDSTTAISHLQMSRFRFLISKEEKEYIVKAMMPNYEDCCQRIAIKPQGRKRYYEIEPHLMKRKSYERHLDEVVVKATRIQVAYRGDTIVFDASAFALPEGSMLDALIRQMPGTELKDNGEIFVNGKKVDYLTLNGKDFFRGKNKVMLENLPYFVVKDIKVYHKEKDLADRIGAGGENKDYVMDVNLKREYNRSVLANAEVGGGTQDRWMARLFGMLVGEQTNVAVFGNANNVNEDRKPGQDGSWKPSDMKRSIKTTKLAGANIQTGNKEKTLTDFFNVTTEWSKDNMERKSLGETFSNEGNIRKGSDYLSTDKDFNVNARNHLTIRGPLNMQLATSLNYNNAKSWTASSDSTFREHIINRNINMTQGKIKDLTANMSLIFNKQFSWGDAIFVGLRAEYSNSKPNESFSLYKTLYADRTGLDLRNYYGDYHRNGYKISPFVEYEMPLPRKWSLLPGFMYTQRYESRHNSNYRLDLLNGGQDEEQFGSLPSNNAELIEAIDADNSYNSNSMERTYTTHVQVSKQYKKAFLSFDFPLVLSRERMHYTRTSLDTTAYRNNTLFNPSIKFGTYGKNPKRISYNMNMNKPAFTQLMPYGDSTNPLSIRLNNPNLKNSIEHKLSAYFSDKAKKSDLSYWLSADVRITQRAWGTRTTYDTETGAFTYQSDNVDGNWNAEAKAGLTRTMDKQHRLRLSVDGGIRYDHSVDFDIAYDTDAALLSHVNTWTPELKSSLRYQLKTLVVGINAKASARFSSSDRENFDNIHACDYQYGGNLQYTFPMVKMTLATDINMFCRRGYSSSMMNTDDLVWNAQLTRPFCKGNIIAKLQAFDILHQLSNKSYAVNAQGRTETWYNSIPRYLMLTMAFKMNTAKKNVKK